MDKIDAMCQRLDAQTQRRLLREIKEKISKNKYQVAKEVVNEFADVRGLPLDTPSILDFSTWLEQQED